MHGMKPLIGVTTSELRPSAAATLRRHGEPSLPEMALGMTYLRAIEAAGGLPVGLPPILDAFELSLARETDRRGLPVLGVCRGVQALNVARGGTLHQHLPGHRQAKPASVTTHEVRIRAGSRLARVIGSGGLAVNSFHHQAVDVLGSGLRAGAHAPDGIVEAGEGPRPRVVPPR